MRVLTLVIVISFQSCLSTRVAGTDEAQLTFGALTEQVRSDSELSDLSVISGPCMGICPVYEFYYLQDSVAILVAEENILDSGSYYSILTLAEQEQIGALLGTMNWDSFESEYTTTMMDLPTTEFEVRLANGELKKIVFMDTRPQELIRLRDDLVAFISDLEWVPIQVD